jgi:NitT/TauT family transport system ATP-binding protein
MSLRSLKLFYLKEINVAMSQTNNNSVKVDAAETDSAVSVQNISKNYGDVEALRDMSLEFPRGQLTSLLGPSGCGKTTLLKIIAGLLEPTSGHVEVNGEKVSAPGPDRAFVFQDFALLPWATVLKNVAFGLEMRGVAASEREAIAEKYIKSVGLSGFENSHPHELSGGMRQRVGLARALCVDADVLLMDEPFSAVDEQTRRKFQEDLLNLVQDENKTFIFVTHSIEEAVYVSDQIAILLPRPSRVSEIIRPSSFRNKGVDNIRRDSEYLDIVDNIWSSLRTYVE